MRFAAGSSFAGYEIVSRLGRGGMATVYLARESGLGRLVALKVLPDQLADEADFAARFEQEARVIAGLDHPNIVPLYRYGIDNEIPWMALRYVTGGDLESRLQTRPLAMAEGLTILRGVASALDYAHRKGVIHRDLKPQNILLSEDGSPYLADFGVAKLLESATSLRTATGNIFGTPAYMAPEQAMGEAIGPYTDVYALAIICFQWLAGRVPFSADTPHAVLMKQVTEPLPQDALATIPAMATRVLHRGLAKRSTERIQAAGEFIDALKAALNDASSVKRTIAGTQTALPRADAAALGAAIGKVHAQTTNVARRYITGILAVVVLLAGLFAVGWRFWSPAFNPPLQPASPVPAQLPTIKTPAPVVEKADRQKPTAPTSSNDTRRAGDSSLPRDLKGELAQAPTIGTPKNVAEESERIKPVISTHRALTPPPVRFESTANATIKDIRSGLEWSQRDNGTETYWKRAQAYCAAKGSGWRLPSVDELAGLYDPSPDIAPTRCGSLVCRVSPLFVLTAAWYWSGTSVDSGTNSAWVVDLYNGRRNAASIADSTSNRVLCVHGP